MMSSSLCFLIVIIVNLCVSPITCSKILFVLPLASKSETNLFFPIAKALSFKGHEITYLSPTVPSQAKLPSNFVSVSPIEPLSDADFINAENLLEERKRTKNKLTYLMSFNATFIFNNCHKVYQNREFQQLLTKSFDLIFMSGFFNNCFLGLVHKFQVPFIQMTSMPAPHWVTVFTGLRQPPSFVPVPLLEYTDKMDFTDRFLNTLAVWMFSVMDSLLISPAQAKIYRQYLGQDYPDAKHILENVSLIMSNSHFSINFPRPVLPDILEVGGVHCRLPQPLPKDLEHFISGAKDGVIYFSLGSIAKSTTLPESTRKIFVNVFSKLKQRVLWKWEKDAMEDLPPNIKLSKWVPQQDVLGHSNLRLFMSHGGLLSTQESIYHGVPVLGLALFVDQDVNMRQAQEQGYGIPLEILELTEEKLEAAIKEMLTNPSYKNRAIEMSRIFRDQPDTSLERATYWVEYILRHKGAFHLRSSARSLNFYQYHSYDVLASIITIMASIMTLAILAVGKVYKIVVNKPSKKLFNKKRK